MFDAHYTQITTEYHSLQPRKKIQSKSSFQYKYSQRQIYNKFRLHKTILNIPCNCVNVEWNEVNISIAILLAELMLSYCDYCISVCFIPQQRGFVQILGIYSIRSKMNRIHIKTIIDINWTLINLRTTFTDGTSAF